MVCKPKLLSSFGRAVKALDAETKIRWFESTQEQDFFHEFFCKILFRNNFNFTENPSAIGIMIQLYAVYINKNMEVKLAIFIIVNSVSLEGKNSNIIILFIEGHRVLL